MEDETKVEESDEVAEETEEEPKISQEAHTVGQTSRNMPTVPRLQCAENITFLESQLTGVKNQQRARGKTTLSPKDNETVASLNLTKYMTLCMEVLIKKYT